MSFSIPESIVDWAEKLAYCTAAKEKLRLDHNVHGASFLAQTITEAEWKAYQSDVFFPLTVAIDSMINTLQDATEGLPTVDLAWFTEAGLVLPEGTWSEQYGLCRALLKQDLTEEQMAAVCSQECFRVIPQEALDAITLSTQQLTQQKAFLVLKDGTKQPLTMEVESTSYSNGRVDRKIIVPAINTGTGTNN